MSGITFCVHIGHRLSDGRHLAEGHNGLSKLGLYESIPAACLGGGSLPPIVAPAASVLQDKVSTLLMRLKGVCAGYYRETYIIPETVKSSH